MQAVTTIGLDIGSPVVTLTTYAHLFSKTDVAAASAIEAALRTPRER